MANLQSPAAKGLFQRAINESGTRIKVFSPDFALKKGKEFAEKAGCPDASVACLRGLSTKAVMDAQAPIRTYVTDFPTVDGKIITKSALDAYRSGDFNHVPILTGLVQDEQSFFVPEVLLGTKEPLTQKGYDNYLASFGPEHREQLTKKYPVREYETPTLVEIAVAQKSKACTARMLNKAWQHYVPVYAYEFRDRTAPSYYPKYSFPLRAYHTAELQYLFPLFHGGGGTPHPLNADQEKLSDQIIDYWTSFARDGAPKAGTSTLRSDPWKQWTPEADNVQYLDLSGGHQHNGYGVDNDCDVWDGVLSFK
jgi:para-nitrobenzyl esterase